MSGTTGPDTAWGVATAANGDVLLAGHEGPALATDLVVRRLSPAGRVIWEGRWDSGRGDEAFVVTEGPDGLVWVGGMHRAANVLDADTTAALVRFDGSTGKPVGQAWTWDSGGWDELDGIAVSNGVVYVSGWGQRSSGNQELRVYALDASTLGVLWQNALDTAGLDAANGHLVLWRDVVVVGGSWNSGGVLSTAQGIVAAFRREDGALAWSRVVGDKTDYREVLGLASDGSRLFAAGWRKVTLSDWQLHLWALDTAGRVLWESDWGGPGQERSRALAYDGSDNSLIVAGTTNGSGNDNIALLRVDADTGAVLQEQVWGGPGADSANDVTVFGNRLYASGPTRSWGKGSTDLLGIGVCHRPWVLPATN